MGRILVIGASGMLGFTLLRRLGADPRHEVHGTLHRTPLPSGWRPGPGTSLHAGVDATRSGDLDALIDRVRPDQVINCAGLIKQLESGRRPVPAITVNALLPHRLAERCSAVGARLIHFSTDCVFSGSRGGYLETDPADADDLYGRSKHLGEVDYGDHLTLRTSLIGHEIRAGVSLVDWFLAAREPVAGYAGAVFSGLPTVEVAGILADRILPARDLRGLFHLSADPIDKDRLLRLVARTYGHDVPIRSVAEPRIDRSLDSGRLRAILDYRPPAWEQLVEAMHRDYLDAYAGLRAAAGAQS